MPWLQANSKGRHSKLHNFLLSDTAIFVRFQNMSMQRALVITGGKAQPRMPR